MQLRKSSLTKVTSPSYTVQNRRGRRGSPPCLTILNALICEIPEYSVVSLGFSCAEFFVSLLSLDHSTYFSSRENIPFTYSLGRSASPANFPLHLPKHWDPDPSCPTEYPIHTHLLTRGHVTQAEQSMIWRTVIWMLGDGYNYC